jgi:hypothetical protein
MVMFDSYGPFGFQWSRSQQSKPNLENVGARATKKMRVMETFMLSRVLNSLLVHEV